MECPSRADLLDFLNDRLQPAADRLLSDHIEACDHCQQQLDSLTDGPAWLRAMHDSYLRVERRKHRLTRAEKDAIVREVLDWLRPLAAEWKRRRSPEF